MPVNNEHDNESVESFTSTGSTKMSQLSLSARTQETISTGTPGYSPAIGTGTNLLDIASAMSSISGHHIHMQGILHKWTNYASGWKRRFFRLEDYTLLYTKSEDDIDYGARGTIQIIGAKIQSHASDSNYFTITAKGMNTYHLRAENPAEREKWVVALRATKMRAEEETKKNQEIRTGASSREAVEMGRIQDEASKTDEQIRQTVASINMQRDALEALCESIFNTLDIAPKRDEKSAKYLEMFMNSSKSLTRLVDDLIAVVQDRERGWQHRWEKELQKRRIFEESLRVLATENNQLELHAVMSQEEEASTGEFGPIIEEAGTAATTASDEFFDALESVQRAASTKEFLNEGYTLERRIKLQAKRGSIDVSVWSVLKDAIGKDLTKISIPVVFNEPISMLQRLCEDMEYSHLLDRADRCSTSLERLIHIAGWAVSNYSSTVDRTGKPFNPLLGETYELIKPERGFRYIAEQVSHHPPISACHCESDIYEYYADTSLKNKFWGKSIEVIPLGNCHLRLKRHDELYTWKKPTTCVHNLIVGTLWIDHYGELIITNHQTKERCQLKFLPTGWRGRNACEMHGSVYDSDGREQYKLFGKWNDKFMSVPISALEDLSNRRRSAVATVIWRVSTRPENAPDYYNFTKFAIELNEITSQLRTFLPPTDSRLRPDQVALEQGDKERATNEKNRLENEQRTRRRRMEADGQEWKPIWFQSDRDEFTGDSFWRFKGDYWRYRKEGLFKTICPNIFG
jgi:oxysterol-binding protein 1